MKLWDMTIGECLQTLEGHYGGVNSVSISPDETKVASGSNDETVKLWDVPSGECLQADAGGAFSWCEGCVVFSRRDEGCVGVC